MPATKSIAKNCPPSVPKKTRESATAGVVPVAIVDEAWQEVGASFERFCLTAGLATLASMMDEDAA